MNGGNGGVELLIFVLAQLVQAQAAAPQVVPRFVDVTSERAPARAGAIRERTDRRLAVARRLADVRPFPLFDAASGPRLVPVSLSADVDFDGDADRVVASPFGRARLFLNDGQVNGQANFIEAPLCEGREVIGATRFLAFADLDGDGKPELLIAAPSDPVGATVLAAKPPWLDGLALRVQRDAAHFVAGGVAIACSKEGRRDVTAALGLERLAPFRCGTVADLDGDGAPELLLFGGESDDLAAFWERVVPTFARVGADPAAAATAMASLAAPAPPYASPRLLARGAGGRFAAVAAEFPADLADFDVSSVVAEDFDGDGDRDLVLHGGPDGELRLLRNETRAPDPATTPPASTPVAPVVASGFVVRAGVATPAPALDLVAVNGAHVRLDAKRTRPCLVVRGDAVTEFAAEARALEGAEVVLLDPVAADDVTTRARTAFALVSELLAGDPAAAPLLRIDGTGCVDLVAGGVTLAQLRDFGRGESTGGAAKATPIGEDRAVLVLPRAEREAHLPNLALAALTKLEAMGATGLDLEFAEALVDTRKFVEAMERFAKVPPASRGLGSALLELGRRLDRANHDADAKSAFERAIDVAPADPVARFELGRLLLLSKKKDLVDVGTESLRVATYLKPDYAEAQYAFGQGLAFVGRLDEAVAALERALALDPDAVQSKSARELLESLRNRKKQ